MAHQVLARKWRPRRFEDVVGQPMTVQALQNALSKNYLHHAYLFTGTRGVGKTTLGRIIAKCLNCETGVTATPCNACSSCQAIDAGRFPDLYEVDAASRTKVEDTRELLENVQYAPTNARYKVYLIDEVHMLSGHSFNALLKTLEEPPEHVKFLLATTDHQKLPATVLSRCLQFHLLQIPPSEIAKHCEHVLQEENITFEKPAIELLARAARGSMRDALSLLDQSIAHGGGNITTDNVKAMLGTIEPAFLFDIIDALADKNGEQLLQCVTQLAAQGTDFSHALADLLSVLHQIAVFQATQAKPPEENTFSPERIETLAQKLSREDTQLFYQIALVGQRDLPYAPTPQNGFEMTLLRMLAFYPEANVSNVTQTTKTTTAKPAAKSQPTATSPWHALLPQLALSGATLALAQQCSFNKQTDTHLHLLINAKQKPLLQKKHIDRISAAVSKAWQRETTVVIEIGDHASETPAKTEQRKTEEKRTATEKAILDDEKVQRIVQTFDAKLVKESIVPSEEGS